VISGIAAGALVALILAPFGTTRGTELALLDAVLAPSVAPLVAPAGTIWGFIAVFILDYMFKHIYSYRPMRSRNKFLTLSE
jgi:hypothetical protein